MEKELYNAKSMTIYDLKDTLEEYPLNLMYDYFEITENKKINQIFYEEIKKLTTSKNCRLKFYLKNKQIKKLQNAPQYEYL